QMAGRRGSWTGVKVGLASMAADHPAPSGHADFAYFRFSAVPPVSPSPPPQPHAGGYECTLLIGLGVTREWFTPDFEKAVGDGRCQAVFRHGTFVQHWADPPHEAWSAPIVSPCSKGSQAPDRVLFVTANWEFKTVDERSEQLKRVVKTRETKFPSVKRIELMTVVRPPGNVSCGGAKSPVAPV